MPTVNFEAAGLLADIIPDKIWEYCAWCYKPRITGLDLEQHSHARNVLKSLGCIEPDHKITPPFNLYLESKILSYVFPYRDEVVSVKQIENIDYSHMLSVPNLTWEEGRDRLLPTQQLLLWTFKSIGHYIDGDFRIVPRHPTLSLSFL